MALKIVLTRKNEWMNRLRPYKILVDGELAGKIENGKVAEFEVATVAHAVECKVDWCYSNKYEFKATDGDTVYLQVKSGMKGFWIVYVILITMIVLNLAVHNQRQLLGETAYHLRMLLFLVPVLYFIYYLTIGRHKYLLLEKDRTNVFAT